MSGSSTTFVLVHGAWHGGWCYARVAAWLRARGHTVFTPTLTGQGERAHLLSGGINLSTHIEDVLGVFRCERLRDVVLAGHSYGGMVITGVADRIPDRINALAGVVCLEVQAEGRIQDLNQRLISSAPEMPRSPVDELFLPHVSIAHFTSNDGLDRLKTVAEQEETDGSTDDGS